jgi:prevent-host-death family protein
MKIGLREANQNFSRAIKAIKSGKVIVLTERGKPIATITPIIDEARDSDELQPLRDEGFLIGRRRAGPLRTGTAPQRNTGSSISRILRQERDED